ncbi:MAG: glycosyltransferase [Planctomycetes bacterium]|nr:glycosyltransferase [Planctomycetota bacterium]
MPKNPHDGEPMTARESLQIELVAPRAVNPLTGGHLYNSRVCECAAPRIVLRHVEVEEIGAWLDERTSPCLLDSLYFESADPSRIAKGPPVIWLAHYLPHRAPNAPAELEATMRTTLAAARGIVTTSQATANLVLETNPRASVRVCIPGVDASPSRRTTDNPVPRLLTVANFEARKGHLAVLECLAELRSLPWTWDVVGDLNADREVSEHFLERLHSLDFESRVRVLGRLDPTTTREKMFDADLFILLSSYEPYGMVFAESIASGTPVIAWRCGGATEIVDSGVTGVLLPPHDLAAVSSTLEQLLSSRRKLTQLRRSVSQSRRRFPTWRETSAELVRHVVELSKEHD